MKHSSFSPDPTVFASDWAAAPHAMEWYQNFSRSNPSIPLPLPRNESKIEAVSTIFLMVEKPRITMACESVLILPGNP